MSLVSNLSLSRSNGKNTETRDSLLKSLFGFDSKTMSLRKEVIGGITTFLTMAYILAVNPIILADAGMEKGAVFTVTVVSAFIATVIMALYAKLPFALAPGMGLNAFFAYTVVITLGYSWQFALTAVFLEGLLFILLTVTGLRTMIVNAVPLALRRAIAPGIGLFIAFIGMKNAGIVVANDATLVTLGNVADPAVLLALAGLLLSAILVVRNVTGGLLVGILLTTAIGIPLGVTHFQGFFDTPPSMAPVAFQLEWHNILTLDMVICVLTFLFIDMFDTIGTLIGVGTRAGMVDKNGNVRNLNKAFMADAVGTTLGAVLGTSTVTTYVESASGVNAGGRSGVTAMVTALCFACALFLAPMFGSIPTQATAPALIIVGVMMMSDIGSIDFRNYLDAIPAFLTIVLMPLTYSISNGIMLGIVSYCLLRLCSGKTADLKPAVLVLSLIFILRYIFL